MIINDEHNSSISVMISDDISTKITAGLALKHIINLTAYLTAICFIRLFECAI